MTPELIPTVHAHMAYRPPEHRCSSCRFYKPADSQARNIGTPDTCTLNPAIAIPVDPAGSCKFYLAK